MVHDPDDGDRRDRGTHRVDGAVLELAKFKLIQGVHHANYYHHILVRAV